MFFDYYRYEEHCSAANERAKGFLSRDYLPVCFWTLGDAFGKCSRFKEESLITQLKGIMRTIVTENDWVPYLEAWHGVGVYAQAFGSEFIWSDMGAPWTKPVIDSLEKLRRLERPMISDSEMLNRVLETTEYFVTVTDGRIPVSSIDSLNPIGTLSLVADTCFMLENIRDYPDDFHRVLNDITEMMIEFTLKQRSICPKVAYPGNCLWSPDIFQGSITLSEDIMVMFGSDIYEEFVRPYDERISEALGGIAVHSCGRWKQHYASILKMNGLQMVDMALSEALDPDPNDIDDVVQFFSGTDIPVHARVDYEDNEVIDKLLMSDIIKVIRLNWNDDASIRQRQYTDIKKRYEGVINDKLKNYCIK